MKLYTEEQVLNMLRSFHNLEMNVQLCMLKLTPIKIPEYEEIIKKADEHSPNSYQSYRSFCDGAEWIKEKILNQNKQNTNTSFTPHNANAVAEYNEGLKNFTPNN